MSKMRMITVFLTAILMCSIHAGPVFAASVINGLSVDSTSGNVGVGIDTPRSKLEVGFTNGLSDYLYAKTNSSNYVYMGLGMNAYFDGTNWKTQNNGSFNGGSTIRYEYAFGALLFYVVPSTGVASPQTISPSTFDSTYLKMIIANNGYVGIGITAPQQKLDVNGLIRSTGNLVISDELLKENINTLDSSLDKVTKLRGVSFNWKDKSKGKGREIGVIAQEVEQVFPEVVSTDEYGVKSVGYQNLIAPLIESVKELKDQNERLTTQVEELKSRIAKLEKKS